MIPHRYFVLHKPRNMVSQFVSADNVPLLTELQFPFPEGTHAIGRLDKDSEGLLLLTTNKKITRLLFEGEQAHRRDYLVMVKNVISEESIATLRSGVSFKTFEGAEHFTGSCAVHAVADPKAAFGIEDTLAPHIPHSWLHISLTEGKYHQVRKMTFAVHHRCLRLIRVGIEDMKLGSLKPGAIWEPDEATFFRLLHLGPVQ